MAEQHRLIDTIINQIKKQAKSHQGKRPVAATVKVAETASVTPQVLTDCFRRAAAAAGMADVSLSVQIVPLLGYCEKCNMTVEIDTALCCRRCHRPYVEIGDPDTVILESCELT